MHVSRSPIDRLHATPQREDWAAETSTAGCHRPEHDANRPLARAATLLAAVIALSGGLASAAFASNSNARPASRAERQAIISALVAQDGSASGVDGVYVSRSNGGLAVVCERTPERRLESYVFVHGGGKWRFSAYGPSTRMGNSADRRLELACH